MHPDVSAEQAYFDTALEHRERARAQLDRAPDLSTDPATAAELRRRLGAMGLADPDEGVAFGRIDRNGERLYIGKNAIWDDNSELLVINWQAPAAAAFYTATPRNPQGLERRRTYRCESNRILDIDEMVFSGLADAIASGSAPQGPVLDDALLESLGRNRSGELADIVSTIQAHQYDVISRPIEQLLVVQGGPGTGKTVVGLHRISWLLYNLSDRLQSDDVLVVGPNPAFVRYIRAVLPKLGDEAVVQRPVTELGPRVRGGRVESPITRKLKGDRRMIEIIVRGLRNRQRIDSSPVSLTIEGRQVTLDAELIAARASQLERRPHNEAHAGLREFLVQEVQAYLGRRGVFDSATLANIGKGASGRAIDNYLERVWPKLTPQSFVLDLFSTRRQLEAAAEGVLDEHEMALLSIPRDARVGTWEWSIDDIPILDAADFLLNGPQRTYEYIVVDEAQDLSPMQLLSIARRSRNGWMTVLGDLAQATSPAALGSWNEVADHLYRPDVPADLAELRLGYRLPTEVHEVAMRLLREISPGLATPEAVRPSGHDVQVVRADSGDLAKTVVATIRPFLGTGLIGIITPEAVRDDVTAALDAEGLFWAPELQAAAAPIVVLSAEAAKGLEFDNVVVVEPDGILADHGTNGQRALFVALTRCTRRLAIVHRAPLPAVLGLGGTEDEPSLGSSDSSSPSSTASSPVAVDVSASPGAGADWASAINRADPGASAAVSEAGASPSSAEAPAPAAETSASSVSEPASEPSWSPAASSVPAPAASAASAAPTPAASAASAAPTATESAASAPSAAASSTDAAPAAGPAGELAAERWVASPVVTAIAESLIGTLSRMVQPALVPDVVEQLQRIVSERYPSSSRGVAVHLPAELVERVNKAVADGAAESVSAYIAAALEDKQKLQEVAGHVHQMLADAGGPLPTSDSPSDPA
ncbi:MAG TPA: ATP-binding domain-containing protein [Acidimicrobiales bacterium]